MGQNQNPNNPAKTHWYNFEWLAPTPKAYPGQPNGNGNSNSNGNGTNNGSSPSSPAMSGMRTTSSTAYNPSVVPTAATSAAVRAPHTQQTMALAASSPLVQVQGAPLQFSVPSGCNAVRFTEGPAQATPNGLDSDLASVIAGGASISPTTGLKAGDSVTYTPLWLTGESITLGANRVRREVYAHFYAQSAA